MTKKMALGKGFASLLGGQPTGGAPVVQPEQEVKSAPEAKHVLSSLNTESQQISDSFREQKISEQPNTMVSVDSIIVNPSQPRKIFKDEALVELANSIKENGVIQPLIVSKEEKGFRIIAGERRFRAAKLAGLEHVPVVIRGGTEKDKMFASIIENVQRADLNCVEEALAYYQLMDDFKLTQEEVAKKIGKDRSSVANFLRILKLPRRVIDYLQQEQLSFGHAKVLASLKDDDVILRISKEVVEKGLSVREMESLIKSAGRSRPTQGKVESDGSLDQLKEQLERKTSFHFELASNPQGSGKVVIKFSSRNELEDIYKFLMR